MKFRSKLLILTLLISLIPLTIISGVGYIITKDTLTHITFQNLGLLSDAEESRITDILEADFETIDSITSRTALREYIKEYNETQNIEIIQNIKKIILDVKEPIKTIQKILILDTNGMIISTTESQEDIVKIEPILLEKIKGKSKFIEIVQINDSLLLKVFGSPIVYDDETIGMVLVYADPKRLLNAQIQGFGNSGEFLLGRDTANGKIELISLNKDLVKNTFTIVDVDKELPISRAILGIEGEEQVLDYKDVKVFAVTKYIKALGWGMVIKINQSEALEFLNYISILIGLAYVIIVFLIIILSLVTTKSFTHPIISLRKYSKKIADGDYHESIIHPKEEELKELYDDLEFMKNKLKNREEELRKESDLKDQFINIAAHELKTPVQPIINYAKLAIRGWADKKQSLEIISQEGGRLQKLTNNILDVSRMKSGTYRYDFKQIKLNSILLRVIELFNNRINNSVNIQKEISPDVTINADEGKLAQVFENIIGNAIKFTDKGTIHIKTKIIEKNTVDIIIEDSAGGIPEEILPKLFEKFATKALKNSTVEGTGLGLFISKNIIDSHGGKLEGYNNDHNGATFIISLPIKHQ